MKFEACKYIQGADFTVKGASYIGAPVSNTAMYITKKVKHLLDALNNVEECLVFAESGITVPAELKEKHGFVFVDNPQLAYAEFADAFNEEKQKMEKTIPFLNIKGAYISQTAKIAEDTYIEPGCVIGPDVVIGYNSRILAGCIIKNAVIGDNFLANECAVIGANGFTMATDSDNNKYRIPSLGIVRIGNNVEIGAHDNISRGSAGDTLIDDYVKIDAMVHIGHDVHLKNNVEITAGSIIGGFDILGEGVYVGLNSSIRNRRHVGAGAVIGMGTNVLDNVPEGITVIGSPAKEMKKR